MKSENLVIKSQYISSNCNSVIDDINKDSQTGNYDIDKKSSSHEVVDSTSSKAETKLGLEVRVYLLVIQC